MGVGQYQLLSLTNLHISRAYYNTRGFFFPHSQSSMGDPGQKESLLAMIQEPRHLLAYGFAIFNTRLPVLPWGLSLFLANWRSIRTWKIKWQVFRLSLDSPGLKGLHLTTSIHALSARTPLTLLHQTAKEPDNDGGWMVYLKIQEEEKRVWWLDQSLSHSFCIHKTKEGMEIGNWAEQKTLARTQAKSKEGRWGKIGGLGRGHDWAGQLYSCTVLPVAYIPSLPQFWSA